jgi:outer membrane protein OmpA-like peptidoglycan-associated protein
MTSTLPEIEEQAIQEKGLTDGPSNPMAQHAYEGFAKRQSRSRSGSGLALGVTAVGVVLVLASIFGLWLISSVRRLNRQVTHLNRQTEQLNRRLQGAEQQVNALDQKTTQALSAQTAALRSDQTTESQATPAAQAQTPSPSGAAAQKPANQAAQKAEEYRKERDEELQKLQRSLGQIAETHRTAVGLVMTLGEKSLRFASGKSDIAPQYRGTLNRIAGVLMPLKGYSINVYGYTDDAGTRDYNLKLSARRARAVRDFLVNAGIDSSLTSTKGFGKSKPVARGSNPKAGAANRRVEIGIVDSTLVSGDQSKVGMKR